MSVVFKIEIVVRNPSALPGHDTVIGECLVEGKENSFRIVPPVGEPIGITEEQYRLLSVNQGIAGKRKAP